MVRRPVRGTRGMEYWWSFTAFFTGGLGTLTVFGFLSISAELAVAVALGPLVLMSAALTSRSLLAGATLMPPAAFALVVYFAILLTGPGLTMTFVSLIAFLPALIVPVAGYDFDAIRSGALTGVGTFLLVLVGLAVTLPQALIFNCIGVSKCSRWGVKLGAFASGNALGVYLAAAAAITFLSVYKWRYFLTSLAGSLLLVELVAARSGMVSFGAAIGIAASAAVARRLQSRVPVTVAAAVLGGAATALPFMNWSASDLTFRPVLWWYAIRLYQESPFVGYGGSYWVRDGTGLRSGWGFALGTNYSTHNLALELLVNAGLIGALAFLAALVLAILRCRDLLVAVQVTALAGMLFATSMTEVFSAPGRNYLVPGFVIYTFVLAYSRISTAEPPARSVKSPNQKTYGLFPAT